MRLPLALRALTRAPVRRLAAAITRDPTFWVPSDDRVVRDWAPTGLSTATSARAVREVTRQRRPHPSTDRPVATLRRLQALTLACHAGYLSPALLDWCLRHGGALLPLVRNLVTNPAVTPQDLRVVQGFLEEQAWRATMAARLPTLWGLGPRVARNLDLEDAVSAWLAVGAAGAAGAAQVPADAGPADAGPAWSPFMTQVVTRQLRATAHPTALEVLALPAFPEAVRDALRTLVIEDADREVTRAACRTAPRILTVAEIETQLLWRHGSLRHPLLLQLFDTLPRGLQVKYWREDYRFHPARAVSDMAACADARWPGLTADDLQPLLTHSDAPVRLAAIQLIAQLPSPADISGPAADVGVPTEDEAAMVARPTTTILSRRVPRAPAAAPAIHGPRP